IRELGLLQQQKKSIGEMGFEILEKNLKETEFGDAFDVRRIFDLLERGETDKAMEIIVSSAQEKPKP
ncbi:MAG: hypothetical protein V1493_04545, partial [Candidatus Diapherotrites archaeon]